MYMNASNTMIYLVITFEHELIHIQNEITQMFKRRQYKHDCTLTYHLSVQTHERSPFEQTIRKYVAYILIVFSLLRDANFNGRQ